MTAAGLAARAEAAAAQGWLDEALEGWRALAALRPDMAAAHNNLGATLHQLRRRAEAAEAFETALALQPDYAEALCNLGSVLCELGRLEEGAARLRSALRVRPDYPKALCNLGSALRDLGETGAALESFRAALDLAPDFVEAHCHYGYLLLRAGRLREGWGEFEWRSRLAAAVRWDFPQPAWRGEAPDGGTLLVHAEEGFGDTIQFWRYVPMLADAGHRVIFRTQPPLARLLAGQDARIPVVPIGEPLPDFDRHCLVMGLPRQFGTELDTIPSAPAYLRADPTLIARWRARLDGLGGPRIGLVWQGNPNFPADRRRSIDPALLAPLATVPGAVFVSLQKGAGAYAPRAAGLDLHDWTTDLTDFAETAALIAALDLVIGVDTAVVHLAGALGRPVWLLNRFDTCWRWLDGREDSPWYPTLRQFRQERPGEWAPVVARVAAVLAQFCAAQRGGAAAQAEAAWRAHAEGDPARAELLYRAALAMAPDHDAAHHGLGVLALERGQPLAALPLLGRAAQLRPEEPAYHVNLGNALRALGSLPEAIACYRTALDLGPGNAIALSNLSNVLRDAGDAEAAEAAALAALELDPQMPEAHAALAFARLIQGRLAEAWPAFRWRRALPTYRPRADTAPAWQGEALGGATLLVYADEGFGDAIQFARFIPRAAARARVVLEVPPGLVRLFAAIPGTAGVVAAGEPVPDHVAACALLDLPGLFGLDLADIAAPVPYLHPPADAEAAWRARLGGVPGRKVGIAWAGSPLNPSDSARSVPLRDLLEALSGLPGVTPVSLQKGPGEPELEEVLRSETSPAAVLDFGSELHDFADTAALIATLDLVISVDTAVAHLAGALGRPVWLLNRFDTCWRWQRGRDDSPWYPTLRQFRQEWPGDWAVPLAALRAALEAPDV